MSIAKPPMTREILLVSGSLEIGRGGQERSVAETKAELERRGIRVLVAVAGNAETPSPGSGIIPLQRSGTSKVERLSSLLEHAERVVAHYREERPVISMLPVAGAHVYLPRGGLYPEAYARSRASRGGVLRRLPMRRTKPFSKVRRLLMSSEEALLKSSDAPYLVALSNYVADQARRWYAVPQRKLVVIRNGVDLERLKSDVQTNPQDLPPPWRSDDGPRFLAAAHNHRLKGIRQFRAAFARMQISGRRRAVVFGGPKGPRRATDGGGSVFSCEGPTSELAKHLHLCDVLVHPTFYDPSSRIVLEAIALQKPIITTRFNGAADFVGEGGIVLDNPRDVRGLSRAMDRLMEADERAACSQALAEAAVQVSIGRHVDELLALLAEAGW